MEFVQLGILAALFAGVSAIIVSRARQKWLVRTIVLWLLAPAIPMAVILVLGTAVSSAPGTGFYNLAFAVMLIGSIILVPWVVLGGIGVAIGLALRRRRPPEPEVVTPSVLQANLPVKTSVVVPSMQPSSLTLPQTFLAPDAPKPHFSQTSPDGSIRVDIEPVEWASSQFVHTPRVIEVATGRVLCDLLDSDWEANTAFPRERYVWLGLRRYRSPGYLFAEFDLDADRYRIALNSLEAPDEEGALADISGRLEHWWQRATAIAAAQAPKAQPVIPPGPFAAWRTALVILIGALVAIGVLTYVSVTYNVDVPHLPVRAPMPRLP
jgi:hypothetical protein